MYELIQVGEHTYYIQSPAKVGVYVPGGKNAWLIDAGGDKDAGRRVRKVMDEQGWTVKGILVTHSNADHIGGCKYLQGQYGCKVFSGGVEGAFTQWPKLEPSFLYGGYPFAELRHKFLMAEPCQVSPLDDPDYPPEVVPISLPGHFFDMVGFRTPDDVVFLADCVSSAAVLEKYHIGFIYDVAAYLKTLGDISALSAALFVPAHADACADVRPLAELNRAKVEEVAEAIVELCREPVCFEALLQKLFARYGLTMTFEQYVLVGSTVRSYLAWLKDGGKLNARIEDNTLLWEAASM